MELVITEKASVALAIAKVLGAGEKCIGYLKGGGYIISWCVGHLVEPAAPETYGDSFKQWSYRTLPILPDEWKYAIKKETRAQFNVLESLMNDKEVTGIICATDAGREGELIFRLVYEQAGCSKPVRRLWISSMEEGAIRDGFNHLKPGSAYESLYQSALCRQRADWLVGINGTRLFTVLYQNRVLKVGRVQTPTLAMLVEREAAVQNFKRTPFYTLHLLSGGVDAVSEKYPDRDKAEEQAAECRGVDALVKSVLSEDKQTAPPRLYDLTTLQRDANRIFSFTAKQTLDYTQSLYEKKLCTYPRTDSQYLSGDMRDTAEKVLLLAGRVLPYKTDLQDRADFGRILDSGKVTDHHAIIPTAEIGNADITALPDGERKILVLLAHRLLCSVSSTHRYRSVRAEIHCGGSIFTAGGTMVIEDGWKRHDRAFKAHFKAADDQEAAGEKTLPQISEGMMLPCVEARVAEGRSHPPQRFTEDSLLAAMERAGAEDMDSDVERRGLGTPATRADIIEKLVKDGFVRREKKQLVPTEDGMKLITVLPDAVKSPKLTAEWENTLSLIAKGEHPAEKFMEGIRAMVTDLVKTYHAVGEENQKMFDPGEAIIGQCPKCNGGVIRGKYGFYCSKKCGMNVGNAFGRELTEEQVKSLLAGKKILLKDLKSRNGGTYAAYLTPAGVEPHSYRKKDGTEADGFQFKFTLEFPKGKGK